MKKRLWMMLMVMICLTGCVGKQEGKTGMGTVPVNETTSVEGKREEKNTGKYEGYSQFEKGNSTNVYTESYVDAIYQYDLNQEMRQEITLPVPAGQELSEIINVSDEWMIYCCYQEENDFEYIYQIPLKKVNGNDVFQYDKVKQVLSFEEEYIWVHWGKNYCVYLELTRDKNDNTYPSHGYRYDFQTGEKQELKDSDENELTYGKKADASMAYGMQPNEDNFLVRWEERDEIGAWTYFRYDDSIRGFRKTKIDSIPHRSSFLIYTSGENYVYYKEAPRGWSSEELFWKDAPKDFTLYFYDCKKDAVRKYITEAQMKKVLQEEGVWKKGMRACIEDVMDGEKRTYYQVGLFWKDKKEVCRKEVLMSTSLAPETDLRYEEVSEKFDSEGSIYEYFWLSSFPYIGIGTEQGCDGTYNLETGEEEIIELEDSEEEGPDDFYTCVIYDKFNR